MHQRVQRRRNDISYLMSNMNVKSDAEKKEEEERIIANVWKQFDEMKKKESQEITSIQQSFDAMDISKD